MSFDDLMKAKAARDAVRATLVRELRQLTGLPDEIQALLRADERATEEFSNAVRRQHEEDDSREGVPGIRAGAA